MTKRAPDDDLTETKRSPPHLPDTPLDTPFVDDGVENFSLDSGSEDEEMTFEEEYLEGAPGESVTVRNGR